jgi:prepilin-type N-terminal cleavage/methylation domain-containing protein
MLARRLMLESVRASNLGLGRRRQAEGMTMIEVLIAILLFAVFSGIFVVVTEFATSLAVTDQPSAVGAECMGSGEDRACIELYFDQLVDALEASTYPAAPGSELYDVSRGLSGKNQCSMSPESLLAELLPAEKPALTWPKDYNICLYAYDGSLSVIQEDLSASPPRPGLYMLQANPSPSLQASSTRKPVQRLFCRPRYLCV